ncbi:MAG: GtrA family protein [Gammaproteobacteria bacterium]|nr:GtrA family protein [Gammaproteobacteria bacterium]
MKPPSLALTLRFGLCYLSEHRIQLVKFISVGLVTFGINFSFFHLFYGLLHLDYKIAVSFAYLITVASHFLLHRVFTFEAAGQHLGHNTGKYVVMLVLNYTITVMVAWFVVEVLRVSPYVGVIASTAATASTSFFLMKYFVFVSKGAVCQSS